MGGRLAGANTGTGARSAALPVAEDAVRAMVRGCCSTRNASSISSRGLGAKAIFIKGAKAIFKEGAKAAFVEGARQHLHNKPRQSLLREPGQQLANKPRQLS